MDINSSIRGWIASAPDNVLREKLREYQSPSVWSGRDAEGRNRIAVMIREEMLRRGLVPATREA